MEAGNPGSQATNPDVERKVIGKATDNKLKREVALKVLPESFIHLKAGIQPNPSSFWAQHWSQPWPG